MQILAVNFPATCEWSYRSAANQILAFNLILLLANAALKRKHACTARQIFNQIEKSMTQDCDNACMRGNTAFNNQFLAFSFCFLAEIFKHNPQMCRIFFIGDGRILGESFTGKMFTPGTCHAVLRLTALVYGTLAELGISEPPGLSLDCTTSAASFRIFRTCVALNAAWRQCFSHILLQKLAPAWFFAQISLDLEFAFFV